MPRAGRGANPEAAAPGPRHPCRSCGRVCRRGFPADCSRGTRMLPCVSPANPSPPTTRNGRACRPSPACMDIRDAILTLHESDGAVAALSAFARAFGESHAVRAVFWRDGEGAPAAAWPPDAQLPAGIPDAAGGSETRIVALPDVSAEALVAPLANEAGTLVVVGPAGSFAAEDDW